MKVHPSVTAESLPPTRTTRTDSSIIRTIALMAPEKFDNISPCARFYPGMRFLFSDNDTPWLGRRNNEECEAVAIITHADEPPDDLTLPYRTLLKMPLGIIVRPLAVVVEDLKVEGLPPGCIVVKPVAQKNGSTQVLLSLNVFTYRYIAINIACTDYTCQHIGMRITYTIFVGGFAYTRSSPRRVDVKRPRKAHRV